MRTESPTRVRRTSLATDGTCTHADVKLLAAKTIRTSRRGGTHSPMSKVQSGVAGIGTALPPPSELAWSAGNPGAGPVPAKLPNG